VFAGGESRERVFAKPGVYTQMCSMHPEMLSYIFVGTSAYAAVVERDGRFTIPDVPAGTWKVAIWNPRLNAPDQTVTVAPGGTATVRFDLNEGTQSRL
jgi:Polysaccharide lyase family 4, domain II